MGDEPSTGFQLDSLQQTQISEMSEATDAPDQRIDEISAVADQRMLKARVVRQNFTLLYQHLAVADILPLLAEKGLISESKRKEVEAYSQKYAQNIVVIRALFSSTCPPDGLVRLTDVLAMTSGQEQVARTLLDDYMYNQLSRRVPSTNALPGPTLTAPIPSDFSELSQLFQQALHSIMNAFDNIPNILGVVKGILHFLVLPLGDGKVAALVEVAAYKHAKTHREVLQLMSPYWNCLSTDLLQLLTEASGSNIAAMKLSEFIRARSSKGHSVLCCSQASSKLQRDDVDASISPGHRSVHTGPLVALQSLHPAVFARLPEHKAVASRNSPRITAEVNKPLLSLSDYEALTAAVSGFFDLPQQALAYAGCSVTPTALCWLVSADILPYIKEANFGLSSHRLLVEQNVSGIAVGDVISYKCPTIKEVELWEASHFGLVERVCDLLRTVHIGVSDIVSVPAINFDDGNVALPLNILDGYTPLHYACQRGHHAVVSLFLEHAADLHVTTNEGATPLHLACQSGHSAVVSLLLEHGADLHPTTNFGHCVTPLMLACVMGQSEVVSILLEANADINQLSGRMKMTALMYAAREGHLEVLNKLIRNGANIHMKNEAWHTAADLANRQGHREVYQVLRDQPPKYGTWCGLFTK